MRKEHCKIVRRKCKTRRAKREFGPTDVVDTHLKHIALVLVLMNNEHVIDKGRSSTFFLLSHDIL